MSSESTSASAADWTSPGAGVSGGYNGDSLTLKICIVFFAGLAMYNAVELAVIIFLTFKKFQGLYFWSLLISSLGIIPYALGFLLKFMKITTGDLQWLAVTLLTIGWYPMVTGQALVLWSRLHLILSGERGHKIMRYTKWMIIINAIVLHIPTTVLTYGSNGHIERQVFKVGYNIMEKIQMTGFFCQEVVLSSIYIIETSRILRSSLQPNIRKVLNQLIFINAVIIVMDLALLGLEAASLYILETLFKGIIYSIKLKLEFAILGKLVKFVGGSKPTVDQRQNSVGFVTTDKKRDPDEGGLQDMNVDEFVDLNRVQTNVTNPSRQSDSAPSKRKGNRPEGMDFEFDFARFEHVEDATRLRDSASSISSIEVPNGTV